MTPDAPTLRDRCLEILRSPRLEAKLAPPFGRGGELLPDRERGEPLYLDRPARAPELALRGGAPRLPRPDELGSPAARAACLRRFAHHELQAVELFAWALVLWPELDPELRRELAYVLADEQRHCRMYLERLRAHGGALGDEPLSDYFWRHVPAIRAHPRGPLAFLAAMGLTLEQANLDFTALYAEAFRRAGDPESARVSERVHADERAHVALAARWLARLGPPGESQVEAYTASVPFPLEASRAKSRRFDVEARRRRALGRADRARARGARDPGESAAQPARGRVSARTLLFPNLGAEEGEAWRRMAAYPRVRDAARLWCALFPADARAVGGEEPLDAALAARFAPEAGRAALDFCAAPGALVPWLATEEAAALAQREGVALAGPSPVVVAAVHDKAFALERARARGLLAAEIADTAFVLGPDELAEVHTVRCRIEGAVARWPAPLAERFVLKPRLATSGRGRLAARGGRIDPDTLRAALPRLRARGGCVVEPWFARSADLSAQLHVAGPGEIRVLGSFAQLLTASGVPLGHRGRIDRDGLARSGLPWDAELRAAALALAADAARAGFRGACGVD
ncbi:MAG TPA: DUF455 family protein, partial [Myxococcota bacterium]|nr:DUF455 family protein [Myxococcota bacterium]